MERSGGRTFQAVRVLRTERKGHREVEGWEWGQIRQDRGHIIGLQMQWEATGGDSIDNAF